MSGDPFDERPLGGSTFQLSEYPEGYDPNQASQTVELTIDQKLSSRVWKFRLEGLQEIQD